MTTLFGRLSVTWRHQCAMCRPLESCLADRNAQLMAAASELERLRGQIAELGQLLQPSQREAEADAVQRSKDHEVSARLDAELQRVTSELCQVTGKSSLVESVGVVHAWRAWSQRGPELQRENALLRLQLQSLALRGLDAPSMLIGLLQEPPAPTGNEN